MISSRRVSSPASMKGFSLLEVSIVLLIMGLLLSSVLQPFGAQLIERQRKQTRLQMLEVRDALLGYAAANHRFPCPLARANVVADCSLTHGFVPAAELGVAGSYDENGLLVDSWGNPYFYSVSNSDADGNDMADFTTTRGMQEVGMQQLISEFEICNASANCSHKRANQVPLVIVSTGAKSSQRSGDESENLDGDNRFVSRDIDLVGTDQFDDMVVWVSESVLFSELIQARVLP